MRNQSSYPASSERVARMKKSSSLLTANHPSAIASAQICRSSVWPWPRSSTGTASCPCSVSQRACAFDNWLPNAATSRIMPKRLSRLIQPRSYHGRRVASCMSMPPVHRKCIWRKADARGLRLHTSRPREGAFLLRCAPPCMSSNPQSECQDAVPEPFAWRSRGNPSSPRDIKSVP